MWLRSLAPTKITPGSLFEPRIAGSFLRGCLGVAKGQVSIYLSIYVSIYVCVSLSLYIYIYTHTHIRLYSCDFGSSHRSTRSFRYAWVLSTRNARQNSVQLHCISFALCFTTSKLPSRLHYRTEFRRGCCCHTLLCVIVRLDHLWQALFNITVKVPVRCRGSTSFRV